MSARVAGSGTRSSALSKMVSIWTARRVRVLSAEQMWVLIWGLVVYHELFCPPGQLLSEGVDRAIEKHPKLVYSFTEVKVAHVLNRLPTKADPYKLGMLIATRKVRLSDNS